jgi:electron transport complex protein RnfC
MKALSTYSNMRLALDENRVMDHPATIPNAYLPATAHVLLRQHNGNPACSVVSVGDEVREGMVIGVPAESGSTYVHSPIPGFVRAIVSVRLPDGAICDSIEIALKGSFDRLGKKPEKYLWTSMRRSDILNTLVEKGVVTTGCISVPFAPVLAGFPTGKPLFVQALDSEPYLSTERAIMESRAKDVIEGLRIVSTVMQASSIVILVDSALRGIQERVAATIAEAGSEAMTIEVRPQSANFPNRYLEAGEFFLPGTDTEALYVRPSTLVAVRDAVVEAKPFLESYVTVAGGAVRNPGVLKARIGTPIGNLIAECGGFLEMPERLVLGGPFTGVAARDLSMPVTKSMSAILALTPMETRGRKERPCIRCGRCSEGCPVLLDPQSLWRLLVRSQTAKALTQGLGDCISCGICSYVCPSRIELSQFFSAYLGARE